MQATTLPAKAERSEQTRALAWLVERLAWERKLAVLRDEPEVEFREDAAA